MIFKFKISNFLIFYLIKKTHLNHKNKLNHLNNELGQAGRFS